MSFLFSINRDSIKDKSRVLKPDLSDFLIFKDSDLVSSQESKFQKPADQLKESKELSFEPSPVSSGSYVISDEQLKDWLADIIKIPKAENNSELIKETEPPSELREKIINWFFPYLKDIAEHMPKAVNAMMQKFDVKIYVVPKDEKVYKFFRSCGVDINKGDGLSDVLRSKQSNRTCLEIFLKTDQILNSEGELYLKSVLPHEFLHLVDICASNLSKSNNGELQLNYSELLNKRLNGKLDAIVQRQNQNAVKVRREVKYILREGKLKGSSLAKEAIRLYKKNKCLLRIARTKNSIVMHDPQKDFDCTEMFAYSLDLYFKDKEFLKEVEPEMYDIIEKYILPDLSK